MSTYQLLTRSPLVILVLASSGCGASQATPVAGQLTQNRTENSAPATTPSVPGEVHKISFDDLNCGMQADIAFRPWMLTERVKELDGQCVRVSGYMLSNDRTKRITEFILLRNTECKFGPGGQADHLVRVKLDPGVTVKYTLSPVEVVGVLKVNPDGPDGLTWSIFDMTGQSVKATRR